MNPLRTVLHPLDEPPMQASKWLKCPMLVSANEMADLFRALQPFFIYNTGSVTKREEGQISLASFLEAYADYVSTLMRGDIPDESQFRSLFSSVFTTTSEALYALAVEGERQLIRVFKPVVQLQAHRLHYSDADRSFRSMTYGTDGILWGIQFSYPQLFQESKTKEVLQVDTRPEFPNTQLFRTIQKWSRDHTIPTPFMVDGTKMNLPARLGKECLPWINSHPQLVQKGFAIYGN